MSRTPNKLWKIQSLGYYWILARRNCTTSHMTLKTLRKLISIKNWLAKTNAKFYSITHHKNEIFNLKIPQNMESKLLYDMFYLCVLTKEEIISYIEQKEDKYFENIDYYDILYPKNQDEKLFIKNLSKICYTEYLDGELKKKYSIIISLFHRSKNKIKIKETLYKFFFYNSKSLLDIDFDFWNLVETDYELLKDGFEGISNSDIYIKEYLNKNQKYTHLSKIELLSLLSQI